jgi:hypothetical protein
MTTTPKKIAELKRLLALDAAGLTTYSEACAWRRTRAVLPSLLADLEAAQQREQVLREAGQRLLPYIPQILSPEPTCEFEHYHAAKAFRAALAATEGK